MQKVVLTTGYIITLIILALFAAVPHLLAYASPNTRLSPTADIGIYSDSACTQHLAVLDWGRVSPGDMVYQTFYVKNVGDNRLKLTMSVDYWNPVAANGAFQMSWDKEGVRIAPSQVVAAKLTLTVSPNAAGFTTFSAEITIKGTSYGH